MSKSQRIVSLQSRGQKKGFTEAQLHILRTMLASDFRGLALLNVAVDSMLRCSDLLALKVSTVTASDGLIREVFSTSMRKEGGRTVTCVLTPKTRLAVASYIAAAGVHSNDLLFPFCEKTLQRFVKAWATTLGLDSALYSAHSLRRTKASIIYQRTKDIRNIQTLLGHKWITSTQSYLGADQDSAIRLACSHDV